MKQTDHTVIGLFIQHIFADPGNDALFLKGLKRLPRIAT